MGVADAESKRDAQGSSRYKHLYLVIVVVRSAGVSVGGM